jgi:hypothetical protein
MHVTALAFVSRSELFAGLDALLESVSARWPFREDGTHVHTLVMLDAVASYVIHEEKALPKQVRQFKMRAAECHEMGILLVDLQT